MGEVAVKRLHLTVKDAAHREMEIATALSSRTLNNVIPVLDAGEDPDSGFYFVVMPRAERNLQGELNPANPFNDADASRILLDIVSGLIEVSDIVHRDLKPPNILLHNGVWKVTDFGIARFVEESTSLNTLKDCLSPPYAAPEQFQFIHATSATDVYALGCIGYALLTGKPPFVGPTEPDFRDQHLHASPPLLLSNCAPRLKTLLSMMLRKPPSARPSLERVKTILTEIVQNGSATPSSGLGMLAKAGSLIALEQANVDQKQQQIATETDTRDQLADTGRKLLGDIIEDLLTRIENEAPNAERRGFAIHLGQGNLEVSLAGTRTYSAKTADLPGVFSNSKWDVIAAEEIVVHQQHPEYKWSAALWYCRLPNTTAYRWYEASYFSVFRAESVSPYSLARSPRDADLAASNVMHTYQLAFGPAAIDDEDEEEFIERWAALLALGAQGKLGHPRGLPLPVGFWRQHFVS
jgi:serine/threonine-protein kinase